MKTVIEMAHEVGFGGTASESQIKAIERFIDLIRADEREAIDQLVNEDKDLSDNDAIRISKAIRARGNK